MSWTIARPSPARPVAAARASSRRLKRSNTSARRSSGMPGPSSAMDSVARPSISASSTVTAAAAWRRALSSRLRTTRRSSSRSPTTWAADTPGGRCAAAAPGRAQLVEHDVIEIDPFGTVRATGVGAGEEQQVVDHPLHRHDLLQLTRPRGRDVGRLRVASVDLQLGAHAGERRAQLVRGVGDELLLAARGVLQAGEHLVHRHGEAGDLVVTGRLGNPPVELAEADPGDLVADPLDRAQRSPDDEPDHHGQGDRSHGDDPRQGGRQVGDRSRRCRRAAPTYTPRPPTCRRHRTLRPGRGGTSSRATAPRGRGSGDVGGRPSPGTTQIRRSSSAGTRPQPERGRHLCRLRRQPSSSCSSRARRCSATRTMPAATSTTSTAIVASAVTHATGTEPSRGQPSAPSRR